jgi:hypothetical protein
MIPTIVMAAYTASIYVMSDTTYTMTGIIQPANITYAAAHNYIEPDGLDTRVKESGVEIPHLLADDKILFATSLTASSMKTLEFSSGNSDLVTMPMVFGPGGYFTVADSPNLEMDDKFTLSQTLYVDTSASAVGTNITYKKDAFRLYVDAVGSVNATILEGYLEPTTPELFDADTWTDVNTGIAVDTVDSRLEFSNALRDATDRRSYKDYGLISDTLWSTPFQFQPTSKDGASSLLYFGWFSGANNPNGYGGDALTMLLSDDVVRIRAIDAGAVTNSDTIGITYGNTYNVTLKRVSSTNITLTVGATTVSLAIPATIANLRYLQCTNFNDNSAAASKQNGWIDAVGVSHAPLASLTVPVSSGEHALTVEENGTFFGIGSDQVNSASWPLTTNLLINAPLFHTALNANPFHTVDSTASSVNVSGDATWTSSGYEFGGVNGYLQFPNDDLAGVTDFTYELQLDWPTNQDISRYTKDADNAISIYTTSGTRLDMYCKIGGVEQWHWRSTSGLTAGTNYRLSITKSGGTIVVYVNGSTPVPGSFSVSTDTSKSYADIPSPALHRIGRVSVQAYYSGTMGEFQFYNTALTPAQVLANYNATKWKYDGLGVSYPNYVKCVTVPDSTANWEFWRGNSVPYGDSVSLSVNGTQQVYYAPNAIILGTALPDRSADATNNPGTIHWGSNSTGIVSTMSGFTFVSTETTDSGTPGEPSAVPEGNMPELTPGEVQLQGVGMFLYPVVEVVHIDTGYTIVMIWGFLCFLFVLCMGLAVFRWLNNLAMMSITMIFCLAFCGAMALVPSFVMLIFAVAAIGLLVLERQPVFP